MQYPEQLRQDQIRTYLAKLEITGPLQLNLESLNQLLFAQLTHIPFDSLDVWGAGMCPSLALQDLFDKIILRNRGGYCFELNTLFRTLLNGLGFHAYQVAACILNPDGTPQPPAHNVILCVLDGEKYFLDVGYGGPVPYRALELAESLQDGFLLKNEQGIFSVHRVTEEEERPLIQFRDVPAAISELEPLNFYISQRPDSHFRHLIHLNRRNEDGSIYSIDGKEFKIRNQTQTIVRTLRDLDDLKEVMREYFQLDPEAAPLRNAL